MINKKIFSFIFTIAATAVSVFVFANQGNAQGRYANVYSRSQVSSIIKRAEDSSDRFRTDFRNQMNRNNTLSSSQKSQFNGYVANCEEALDRLRSRFDSENTWWNTRNQVQDVINSSQNVNTMMNVLPFRRNLENQWNRLRNDINTLADTFDLPGLNGGGWNGGPWNPGTPGGPGWGGGQTSTPPSWAQGTFYSIDGSNIQMSIASNGRVTVVNASQTYYGTYYRGQLRLNNDTSTVSQISNGIRTYNRNTGQTTDYSRNNWGGPGVGGGNTSRPPTWAQGNFYSISGSNIQLTIESTGRVTVVNNGQAFYGTYYRDTITVNSDASTVSRTTNGIRTYNRNTGQTTDYSRYGWGGGTGPGWGGGNTSTPPSWAQGSFYSANNGSIILTINSYGQVTVVNGGQSYYGTYYNGSITVNNDTSTVSRNGDGIRTYNQSTGQTTIYRRRAR